MSCQRPRGRWVAGLAISFMLACADNPSAPSGEPIAQSVIPILGVDRFDAVEPPPPQRLRPGPPILNSTGGGPVVLDFSGFPDGTLITTQYASLGVTFSGLLRIADTDHGATWPSEPPTAINFGTCCADVTASFDPPAFRAGFYVITNEDDFLELRAFRGGVPVGSLEFDTHRLSADFVQIDVPDGFDALVIDGFGPVNGAFVLDDFTFEAQNDPETKDDCKKGGWEQFGFKNQGQCVRFVETGKDSR